MDYPPRESTLRFLELQTKDISIFCFKRAFLLLLPSPLGDGNSTWRSGCRRRRGALFDIPWLPSVLFAVYPAPPTLHPTAFEKTGLRDETRCTCVERESCCESRSVCNYGLADFVFPSNFFLAEAMERGACIIPMRMGWVRCLWISA